MGAAAALRHFVGVSQTRNVPGEKLGLANKLFGFYYRGVRLPMKRLEKESRIAYFAISYGFLASVLVGLFLI